MPKSRHRKRGKTRTIKMTPEMRDALMAQREAFIRKFGREPGPGDPVFFDPDKDVPTKIDPAKMLRSDPELWNTSIPELLASPYSREDRDQVLECLKAIAPIEARGMKVVTRLELAAALLCSAVDHAYRAAEEEGGEGYGPGFFETVEDLVLRRAREIYGQGGA